MSNRELLARIDAGATQAELAKEEGCSRQAIHNRLRHLRRTTTKAIVGGKRRRDIVDQRLDTMGQLAKINQHANEILDLLMAWGRGDQGALQILETQVRKVRVKGTEEEVSEYKFKDPRELALKAMQEIRGQLDLQHEIFKTLYSIQEAEIFMNTVLEAIAEVSPDVRTKIILKLNARRPLGQAVRFAEKLV